MKPKVVILTTGGTIVSSGATPTQLTGYSLTDFTPEALVASVPGVDALANIEIEPVANIDSSSMTSAIWVSLANHIEALAENPSITGFVVTHGTDTMEETAYFLSLVLKTSKPVVLTGAMRPSTAISADGPIHLLNAIRVAVAPESSGKGVLIVMNDHILCARDARKSDPTNVATFCAPLFGLLGLIAGENIAYSQTSLKRHTKESAFAIPTLPLPRVDIVVSHTDADDILIRASLAAHAKGLIHMGTGNGSIHAQTEAALFEAARSGIPVVRASRATQGAVVNGLAAWQEAEFIPAGTLSPFKARILLQLALAQGLGIEQIRQAFLEY